MSFANLNRMRRKKPDPDAFLKSKRPGARMATVVKQCGGEFSNFKPGDRVRVWFNKGSSYTIERVKWTGSRVPLAHSCYGIPRSCIKIDK